MGWFRDRKVVDRWVEGGTVYDVQKTRIPSKAARDASWFITKCSFVPDSHPEMSLTIRANSPGFDAPVNKAVLVTDGDRVEVALIRRKNGKGSAKGIVRKLSIPPTTG